jgi:hypothetical protein
MLKPLLASIKTVFLSFGTAFGLVAFQNSHVFSDDRPNVLVIVADDLGYKLVSIEQAKPELYDLSKDESEKNNLPASQLETVQRLEMAFREWNQQNIASIFESPGGAKAKQKKKEPTR